MKKIIKRIFLLLMASAMLYSCYYDKADFLYPNSGSSCDTLTTSTYGGVVRPILEQQCYSCHAGNRPSGNIAMGTYNTDKAIAVNGMLYGTINHSSGYSPMPEGQAKMDACSIAKIRRWVDDGSPNN